MILMAGGGYVTEIRLLKDGDLGKTNQIVDVDKKGAAELVKRGYAEYIKTEKKEVNKPIKKDRKKVVERVKENIEKLLENISFEPVLNDSNPKLLKITKKETIPTREQLVKETLEQPTLPEIKLIFETIEPDMWECKKCHASLQSEEKPYYCKDCERETNFKRLTQHINPNLWKLPTWTDIPVDDLDMQNTFIDILQIIKQCLILPEEIQYKLLTLWIIASWKTGCWDAVPFLIFRGLIESGKTRGLDLIRELGCRMMHTSGVTFPAMVRATHFYNAGILLDEIDNKVDKRTEVGRAMIDFLKPSYRKGSVYTVADREDQAKIITYKNFGFKAFAGEKGGYDQAIFSRSIDFQMEQDYPTVQELKSIQFDLNNIQTILLNYKYKTSEPEELPEEIKLKGRDREIYGCIIRTAMHIGIEYDDILDFIRKTRKEKQEETENSDEYQILKVMRDSEHQPTLDDAPETISYADIAETLGWEDKQRQRLGYIFKKKLILKTKRMNKGSVVLLNDPKNIRKLKSLYRRFKL